ncbi:conserved hypothetical protein [uncultured Desulfobacterium sp.]|uniref:Phage tail protein n=1 Tax=uncultured Desulfobacterium sp. TaxID=201089 RepID=A0A445MWR0_9BACT|nr:conserved hypothetical protein [uncultured Desulfobacterium sp.]
MCADVILEGGDVTPESGDVILDGVEDTELVEKQVAMLQSLLPPGRAWNRDADSNLTKLLTGLAGEFGRIENTCVILMDNVYPDTAVQMISDWERVLGLTPEPDATYEDRQTACVAKFRSLGGQSVEYFTQLALNYGYVIDIRYYKPFRVGQGRMGDRLYVPGIVYIWEVVITDSIDPVISQEALEAIFQDLKPAHTAVFF